MKEQPQDRRAKGRWLSGVGCGVKVPRVQLKCAVHHYLLGLSKLVTEKECEHLCLPLSINYTLQLSLRQKCSHLRFFQSSSTLCFVAFPSNSSLTGLTINIHPTILQPRWGQGYEVKGS